MASYAAVTAAWAPDEPQPQPNPTFLDSVQPANQPLDAQALKEFKPSIELTPPVTPPGEKDQEEAEGRRNRNAPGGKVEDDEVPGAKFDHVIKGMDVMERRRVPDDLETKLAKPYMARANIAATVDHPNGTTVGGWAEKHKDQSVLRQHVDFFLRPEANGILWPIDTWIGFRRLGYSFFWCTFAMTVIHVFFSWFTSSSWIPDPFLRVNTNNGHRAKHGSDTGVIDTEGRFVPAKFEEIFAKFDEGDKGGLTFTEGVKMVHALRTAVDPIGWGAAGFEWASTYFLVWPQDGVVDKESIRCVFDGSIFYVVAARERQRARALALARKQMTWGRWLADSIPGPWRLWTRGWRKENKADGLEWKFD
ncbi:hypothetical protein JCM1841_001166 [Sporobolomyces salmonicolor]